MIERNFEVSYEQPGRAETYDVSFRVTDAVEERLMRGLADAIAKAATEQDTFEETYVHLLKRVDEQGDKFLDDGAEGNVGYRVYDLEISPWDYYALSEVFSQCIRNEMGMDRASEVLQMFFAWLDITEQVRIQSDHESNESLIPMLEEMGLESKESPRYRFEGVFDTIITLPDGSHFKKFKSYQGDDVWYTCVECGANVTELGNSHDCEVYEDAG